MKEYLKTMMENNNKKSILQTIVYIIVILLILDQIYALTKFAIKYNNAFHYGNGIKNVCNEGYIEYETPRFQLSQKNEDLFIENDINSSKYTGIFLIICIIILLYFNILVVFSYASGLIDIESFLSDLKISSLFTADITTIIVSIIVKFFKFIDLSDNMTSVLKVLFTIIFYLSILYLVLLLPLYFILDNQLGIDISPFSDSHYPKIVHGIFILIISIGSFVSTQANQDSNKLPSQISPFAFTLLFTMFFVTFHAVKVVYDIYKKSLKRRKNTYEMTCQQYRDGNSEVNESLLKEWFKIIYEELKLFLSNVFWIDPKNDVSLKKIVGLYVAIIIICVILQIILYFKPENYLIFNQFDKDSLSDKNILYYLVMVPCMIVFVVCFIILITKEYNTFINKYLIYKPTSIYKSNISKINTIFNEIIENDKSNIQNNSICKNVANNIHLVLLSYIFKSSNANDEDSKNLFVPEFEYESGCETNKYIQYDKIIAYDIENTINNDNNIFFNDTKCSSIDNGLLLSVMKGVIPKYENVISETDYDNFKSQFITKLINAIYFAKNGKTYSGDRSIERTTEYEINNTIVNVNMIKEIEGVSFALLDDHTKNVVEFVANEYIAFVKYMYNYTLKTITALCKCTSTEQYATKGYSVLMNKIDLTITTNTNGSYSLNIKKAFITRFNEKIKEMFDNINVNLSSSVILSDNNYKLSKMIIENYNNYQEEVYNKFRRQKFLTINTQPKQFSLDDIAESKSIIENINTIIHNDNIDDIEEPVKENLEKLRKQHSNMNTLYLQQKFETTPQETIIMSFKLSYLHNHILNIEKFINKITNKTEYNEIYQQQNSEFESSIKVVTDVIFGRQKQNDNELYDDPDYLYYVNNMANKSSYECYVLIIIYICVIVSISFIQ